MEFLPSLKEDFFSTIMCCIWFIMACSGFNIGMSLISTFLFSLLLKERDRYIENKMYEKYKDTYVKVGYS